MESNKIVILGDAAVGKTSLVKALSGKFQKSYLMTVGFEREYYKAINYGKEVNFSLWDTAGQESMRISKQVFYQGVMGALIVFDLTRPATLEHCNRWMAELRQHAHPSLPVVLVGTKSDMKDYVSIENAEIELFKEKWEIYASFKVSSVTGENIHEIFELIVNIKVG
ncbi:MAG: Rab family GTPase [Candidatus Odinarchaeota archaeon]